MSNFCSRRLTKRCQICFVYLNTCLQARNQSKCIWKRPPRITYRRGRDTATRIVQQLVWNLVKYLQLSRIRAVKNDSKYWLSDTVFFLWVLCVRECTLLYRALCFFGCSDSKPFNGMQPHKLQGEESAASFWNIIAYIKSNTRVWSALLTTLVYKCFSSGPAWGNVTTQWEGPARLACWCWRDQQACQRWWTVLW